MTCLLLAQDTQVKIVCVSDLLVKDFRKKNLSLNRPPFGVVGATFGRVSQAMVSEDLGKIRKDHRTHCRVQAWCVVVVSTCFLMFTPENWGRFPF